jgi:hypothetical protein
MTGCRERSDQRCLELEKPGTFPASGTRASANTSGPDLDQVFGPVKLRSLLGSATNEENFVSSAGPVFGKRKFDPAVDLMSRRHPLSSTGAFQIVTCFREADRLKARVTRRHQPPAILSEARFTSSSWRPCGSSSQSSSLRSSPSSPSSLSWPCCPPNVVRWLNRCAHSGIEMRFIPNTPTKSKKQRPA